MLEKAKHRLTLQPEDEAALVLRISLHKGHKGFHALLEHSSVSQSHGPELRQKVYGVSLEAHLLQGALDRDHHLTIPAVPPTPVAPPRYNKPRTHNAVLQMPGAKSSPRTSLSQKGL